MVQVVSLLLLLLTGQLIQCAVVQTKSGADLAEDYVVLSAEGCEEGQERASNNPILSAEEQVGMEITTLEDVQLESVVSDKGAERKEEEKEPVVTEKTFSTIVKSISSPKLSSSKPAPPKPTPRPQSPMNRYNQLQVTSTSATNAPVRSNQRRDRDDDDDDDDACAACVPLCSSCLESTCHVLCTQMIPLCLHCIEACCRDFAHCLSEIRDDMSD